MSRDVRDHNLSLVLSHLLGGAQHSRSYLARATGLTPSSITAVVEELEESHWIRSVRGARSVPGTGERSRELLELDNRSFVVAAVELRSGGVRFECQSLSGGVIASEDWAACFPNGNPGAFVEFVIEKVNPLLRDLGRKGMRLPLLVVVIPGPILAGGRSVFSAIDFGWGRVNLAELLEAKLEGATQVLVVNDANSAAWAEYRAICDESDGEKPQTLAFVKSNIGIGGGLMVDGKVLAGSEGFAFEPGHVVVDPGGKPCRCGKRGCLVTVAGPDVVLERAGLGDVDRLEGRGVALARLLESGEEAGSRASRALAEADRWLRLVLTNMVVLFSPDCLVLGGYLAQRVGELSRLGAPVLDTFGFGLRRGAQAILPSRFGEDAPMVGALAQGREALVRNAGRIARGALWVARQPE